MRRNIPVMWMHWVSCVCWKSDVLKFLLEDNCSLVVRPSGTEPKLKIYISVSAENKEMAEKVEDEIAKTAEKWIC